MLLHGAGLRYLRYQHRLNRLAFRIHHLEHFQLLGGY
ncbi:Uncharacterised protein [Vibrio cholerae]|nr:Uncharacterised protein [Vibrio cholerae]